MKSTELKAMIKEAVKEAIGEELKEILLEAVKSSKGVSPPITENTARILETTPTSTTKERYANILNEMVPRQGSIAMNSSHAQNFTRQVGYNPGKANTTGQGSALPPGEVNIEQIMGLINNK